ncbi:hypothetical protein [Pusillimonas sp.]|uniref:hypothetical protein n=1 Tax=Pusillimonas sp. TaxID=3040095 RepID=UPI0037CC2C19
MNYADLMSPGIINNGFRLRLDCAKAISAVELVAQTGSAGIETAQTLRDFFIECANAADKAAGGSGSDVGIGGGELDPTQAIVVDGQSITVHDLETETDVTGIAVVEVSELVRVEVGTVE